MRWDAGLENAHGLFGQSGLEAQLHKLCLAEALFSSLQEVHSLWLSEPPHEGCRSTESA